LAERAAHCLGRHLVGWRPVPGGYTNALRPIVACADGTSAFVKGATDRNTATSLRTEYGIYSRVQTPYLPAMLAWEDDGSLLSSFWRT
jgi:hypothetical protein